MQHPMHLHAALEIAHEHVQSRHVGVHAQRRLVKEILEINDGGAFKAHEFCTDFSMMKMLMDVVTLAILQMLW